MVTKFEVPFLYIINGSRDLFVQALTSMQTDDQSHLTSYYQIAGIHGRPFAAWDGVHSASGPSGDQDTGYCTHNSILFPSWHRPYMALYEVGQQFCVDTKSIHTK